MTSLFQMKGSSVMLKVGSTEATIPDPMIAKSRDPFALGKPYQLPPSWPPSKTSTLMRPLESCSAASDSLTAPCQPDSVSCHCANAKSVLRVRSPAGPEKVKIKKARPMMRPNPERSFSPAHNFPPLLMMIRCRILAIRFDPALIYKCEFSDST